MRAALVAGLAGAIALVPPAAVDAQDRGRAAMATGTAPAGGWSNVPDVGLNPPAAPPRGEAWGPNGWQGSGPGGPPPPDRPAPPPPRADGRPGPDRMVVGHRDGRGRGGWDRPGPRGGAAMPWTGRYNRIGRGYRVPGYLRQPGFVVPDWWSYGLLRPGIGQSWIRYYDDALLIDGGGRVIDSRYALDWDRDDRRAYPDYGDGDGYESGNYDRGFGRGDHSGGVHVWRSGPGAPDVKVHRAGGGSTVVIVQNPSVATTTTTTYYDTVAPGPRKPRKVWKPKARCNCK